jgi:Inhibitor of Apoptosis domain
MSPMKNVFKEPVRKETFKHWRVSFLDAGELARFGFFYIGMYDMIQCVYCSKRHYKFQNGDSPIDMHRDWNKNCPAFRKIYIQKRDPK